MGKGSGSSTTTQQISPEQRQQIQVTTDFLKNQLIPQYQTLSGQAGDVYGQQSGVLNQLANQGVNASQGAAGVLGGQGAQAYQTGLQGLQNLFSPDYANQQVQAALEPGQEAFQSDLAQLGTQFGGAGGLGSARSALAGTNLASLNAQRQGTVAANVLQGVETNRAAAANQLANYGQQGITGGLNALTTGSQFAQLPQSALNQYASILYGVPGASVAPNFQGTQGSSTQQTGKHTKG